MSKSVNRNQGQCFCDVGGIERVQQGDRRPEESKESSQALREDASSSPRIGKRS